MFVVAHKIIYKEKDKHLEINNNWPETKLSTTTTTIFFNKQIILQRHRRQLARLFKGDNECKVLNYNHGWLGKVYNLHLVFFPYFLSSSHSHSWKTVKRFSRNLVRVKWSKCGVIENTSDHYAFGNSHTEFVSYLHTWTRSGTWDYWVRANSASSHKIVTAILARAWPQQCWKSCAKVSNFVALPFCNHGTKEMLPRSC